MSGIYVTPTGFNTQTFAINKAYWETSLQDIFGNDIDLDPEGPFGQMVGLFAKRDTDIFEAIQEVYTSRDPDQATGVSLDTLYGEKGLIRIAEGATFVPNVLLYGDLATTIVTGAQIKQSSGENADILYSLTGDVTISQTAARDVELLIPSSPATDEIFTITLDAVPYSHTTTIGQTDADVAAALIVLIQAGSFVGASSSVDGSIFISQESLDFSITLTVNISLELIGSAGSFQADTAGVFPAPANTLDTIVSGQIGWDSVNNPTAGTTGRETETDSEFRIRGANTTLFGKATEDAIVNDISNNVAGVTRVAIQSNRTDITDADGLPPHSFEVVVSGGLDQDIADSIWSTQGAGIASFGNETEIVIDSEGQDQTVYFSRPTSVYIHVKVKRDLYSEEEYPADGDAQIKQAIVDWAAINQPIGKDVIRQRLNTPVYSVPGIDSIEITIDGTASPGDTPTYALQNIPITLREVADFDITRIIVEVLTP